MLLGDLTGKKVVTVAKKDPPNGDLAREMDDRDLHRKLLNLCSRVRDPDVAIFNLQAGSRTAQRIVKRLQPLVRTMTTTQGGSGGAPKRGRTIELMKLENGEVQDCVFTEA